MLDEGYHKCPHVGHPQQSVRGVPDPATCSSARGRLLARSQRKATEGQRKRVGDLRKDAVVVTGKDAKDSVE